jgi:DNA-binding HxlR family transcriptional regulator
MAGKRTYGDPCGVARALDVVGERWALLIVRELLLGPKRFTDLRAGLPHLGPDVLSQRLRELEAAGVLRRGKLPPPAASRVYELTDRGLELEPVVLALGRWGSSEPLPPTDAELGTDAFIVALKTMFQPDGSAGPDGRLELRIGDDAFSVSIADGQLEVARGRSESPAAVIEGDVGALREVLWRGADASLIKIEGDRELAARFLELFPQVSST